MVQTRSMKSRDISIISAIETLSNIADLELSSMLEDPVMMAPSKNESPLMMKTVRWLHQKNIERIHSIIREKLHIVLNYLQHCYTSERERLARKESMEGVRTIMMLVDEASENLDRYTKLFFGVHGPSVKKMKEFLDLCDFYEKKIVSIAIETKGASLIQALPVAQLLEKAGAKVAQLSEKISKAPLHIDLEGLQNDIDYELLFIRNIDNTRFFTPDLIRSMRFACDIEEAVDWQQRMQIQPEIIALKKLQTATEISHLFGHCYQLLDNFFHAAHRYPDQPLILDLYAPSIALMMARLESIHTLEDQQAKGILEYCDDFRTLFNLFVHSREFKRLLTYQHTTNECLWEHALLKLAEGLCSNLVYGAPMSLEFVRNFKGFVVQGMSEFGQAWASDDESISQLLQMKYAALKNLIGVKGTTTLLHMLRELEIRSHLYFEPLLGESIPTHLFSLSCEGEVIPIVRLPSPTLEEKIDHAVISEVFQIAARRHGRKTEKFLIVSLQDTTNRKDHSRCKVIEELMREDDVYNMISVLSLPRDGEFYRQEGPYEEQSEAQQFKKDLLEHVTKFQYGVVIPQDIYIKIHAELKHLIDALHRQVCKGHPMLLKSERLELIDLVHILLILRVIDEIHPNIIFISCKDGLDTSLVTMGSIFSFFKLINRRLWSEEEKDWLAAMVLGFPLIKRDRLIFAESYARMTAFVRLLERMSEKETETERAKLILAVSEFLPKRILDAVMIPASSYQPTYFDRRYSI